MKIDWEQKSELIEQLDPMLIDVYDMEISEDVISECLSQFSTEPYYDWLFESGLDDYISYDQIEEYLVDNDVFDEEEIELAKELDEDRFQDLLHSVPQELDTKELISNTGEINVAVTLVEDSTIVPENSGSYIDDNTRYKQVEASFLFNSRINAKEFIGKFEEACDQENKSALLEEMSIPSDLWDSNYEEINVPIPLPSLIDQSDLMKSIEEGVYDLEYDTQSVYLAMDFDDILELIDGENKSILIKSGAPLVREQEKDGDSITISTAEDIFIGFDDREIKFLSYEEKNDDVVSAADYELVDTEEIVGYEITRDYLSKLLMLSEKFDINTKTDCYKKLKEIDGKSISLSQTNYITINAIKLVKEIVDNINNKAIDSIDWAQYAGYPEIIKSVAENLIDKQEIKKALYLMDYLPTNNKSSIEVSEQQELFKDTGMRSWLAYYLLEQAIKNDDLDNFIKVLPEIERNSDNKYAHLFVLALGEGGRYDFVKEMLSCLNEKTFNIGKGILDEGEDLSEYALRHENDSDAIKLFELNNKRIGEFNTERCSYSKTMNHELQSILKKERFAVLPLFKEVTTPFLSGDQIGSTFVESKCPINYTLATNQGFDELCNAFELDRQVVLDSVNKENSGIYASKFLSEKDEDEFLSFMMLSGLDKDYDLISNHSIKNIKKTVIANDLMKVAKWMNGKEEFTPYDVMETINYSAKKTYKFLYDEQPESFNFLRLTQYIQRLEVGKVAPLLEENPGIIENLSSEEQEQLMDLAISEHDFDSGFVISEQTSNNYKELCQKHLISQQYADDEVIKLKGLILKKYNNTCEPPQYEDIAL